MKHFLFRTVAIAMVTVFSTFFEIEAKPTTSPQGRPIELKRMPDTSTTGRKRSPQKDMVFCWYYNNEITIEFNVSVGTCNIEITGDPVEFDIIDSFDSSLPYVVHVGDLENVSILITTETGVTYLGEM